MYVHVRRGGEGVVKQGSRVADFSTQRGRGGEVPTQIYVQSLYHSREECLHLSIFRGLPNILSYSWD
jgi:hypothetical protein